MKVSLVELTTQDTGAIGVRSISSNLRRHGHQTQLIFMAGDVERLVRDADYIYSYDDQTIADIIKLCRQSDIVGISFLTNFFDRAVQITQSLKKELRTPIVWGGIHPTAKPEEAIQYADMVGMGECEEAFTGLLDKMEQDKDYFHSPNFWIKRENGEIMKNALSPLIQNLDSLPFQDYDLEDNHVYDKDLMKIVPLTKANLEKFLQRASKSSRGGLYYYNTMIIRGCPHACSFCFNSYWKPMYKGQRYTRRRSNENVIRELEEVKKKLPFINYIVFADDSFLFATEKDLEEFRSSYSERVGLPFCVQTTPLTITDKKMEYLVEAGMDEIAMGIQGISRRIGKVFHRMIPREKVKSAVDIIHKHRKKISIPKYDFILDTPWETDDDNLENIRLLLEIQRPFSLRLASLVLYPGSKIYDMAKEDNKIKDEMKEIYRRNFMDPKGMFLKRSYLNLVMYYFTILPKWMVRISISKPFMVFFNRASLNRYYEIFFRMRGLVDIVSIGINTLFAGDFGKIFRFLKRPFLRFHIKGLKRG